MIYLNEGDKTHIKGSGKVPYEVKKVGGVVSCSCPAWRNLGGPIDNRVCKHIKANIDPACLLPQAQSTIALTTATVTSSPIKAPVTEPPILLAHKWEGEDPTGWLMSPKMDGVRAVWDGKKFLSRLGNEYHAPESFKEKMPELPEGVWLDGELFAGNGEFQKTVSIVRKLVPDEDEWQEIGYHVFDMMNVDEPFETRLAMIDDLWSGEFVPDNGWEPVEQAICGGAEDLRKYLLAQEAAGGEGVMLRKPGSLYEAGRSHTLLKVKSFFDAEAYVIAHEPGKGKHKGRMGALKCLMPDGKTFSIGTGFTDKERNNPPAVGSRVTYRYQELTNDGIPRFPSFVAERDYEGEPNK